MHQSRHKLRAASTFTVLALSLAVQQACANQINTTNFWYRDFLDLAQNKGQFKAGATGLEITRKDGSTLKLPDIPIPDFSGVSANGNTTAIGGAYSVTATHNDNQGGGTVSKQQWGNTTYTRVDSAKQGDFSVHRLNKFVVETDGVEGADVHDWNGMLERYGVDYQGKKQIIGFRVGSGSAQIKNNGKVSNLNTNFNPNLHSVSFFLVTQPGVSTSEFTDFQNITTGGDSGSGYYVYDSKKKEWVLLGVLGGFIGGITSNYYNAFSNALVDQLKKQWTQSVALDGKNLVYKDNSTLTLDGKDTKRESNKDLSFTGGGTLDVQSNMDLGNGGLVFDKNHTYAVNGKDHTYKGAGVDVGEGSVVDWNIKGVSGDSLHKVGKGTLKVNVTQGSNLKVGNGTVELNAEKAFDSIYITSGNATVKLGHDKALNANEFSGIFFAEKGGTLDLNGHDFSAQRIAAADNGALITNTSDKKANVNITTTGKYAYHGSLSGNLDLNYKFKDKAAANGVLVLDGGTDIKGDINVENGNVTLQGHLTDHATFGKSNSNCPTWLCGLPTEQLIIQSERPDANKHNMGYMIDNQVSSFAQPDWETRTYNFKTLNLKNGKLDIGRNSIVNGNINAADSTITIGSQNVYRDEHSGNNITGEGFGFKQNVIGGQSFDPYSIQYTGDITAVNSTIEANNFYNEASLNLDNAKYKANYLVSITRIRDEGIVAKNKSDVSLKAAYIYDAKKEVLIHADDTSSIKMNGLVVSNSKVDIRNATITTRIDAQDNATVKLDKWTHQDTNLWSDDSSSFEIDSMSAKAGGHIKARVSVNDELRIFANGNRYNLHANSLTLGSNSTLKADLASDAMSVHNLSFDQEYTLVSADKLEDNRTNQKVEFAQANGMHYENRTDGNAVKFTIKRDQSLQNRAAFFSVGSSDESLEERPAAVLRAYAARYGDDKAEALVKSIAEHNASSDLKYQEVALVDALYNTDAAAGAEALNAIESRTQKTYRDLSTALDTQKLFAPVRTAVSNRLASLSMGTVRPVEGESRFFIDAGAGFFNGDDDIRYVHTGFGSDVAIRQGDANVILGGMFGIGRSNNKFDGNEVKSDMYTLTGYLGWQHASGWEVQNFLTGAWLDGDRTLKTEINLGGNQEFDEKGWAVMNSTYLKYRLPLSEGAWNVAVKPMLLADIGWMHSNAADNAYFKRDASSSFSAYAGAGVEFEVVGEKSAYFFQLTGKQRINDDAKTVGVNLQGASGFDQIETSTSASFITDANVMAKFKLTKSSEVDLSVGASVDSNGAAGAHGQARVNFLF